MKVKLEIESIDADGQSSKITTMAVMELRQYDFRLIYIEKVSDDGKLKANVELIIAPHGMRIIRKGDLCSDFFYEENLKHNTTYQTPYGEMPITVETSSYDYSVCGGSLAGLSEVFEINVDIKYALYVASEDSLLMNVKMKVTNID